MAKFTLSVPVLYLFVLLSSLNFGGSLGFDDAISGQVWCVAKPSADEVELRSNIDYVCSQQGMDCSLIQEGGSCFDPATPINHASVVMNLFFQKAGRYSHTCDFTNTALVVVTDPSYGSCLYPFV